jgi:hypothetical protein
MYPLPASAAPMTPPPLLLDEHPTYGAESGRYLVTVPALMPMARTLRAAVGDLLAEHPRRTDARQVVSEFTTTALIENRCTCCPTGKITLTVDIDKRRIRLEIGYHLALTHEPVWKTDWYEDPVDTYGLGLALTKAHSDRWGHSAVKRYPQYADDDHTWWAELNHTRPQPPSFRFST